MTRKYLTATDVADYLQLPVVTVYQYARNGLIPASKLGKHWRFSVEKLDEWMSSQSNEEPRHGPRVVLVPGDVAAGDSMASWLTAFGCESVGTVSGEQAVDTIGRELPDMVFLDLHASGFGGVLGIKRVKDAAPEAEIVILADELDADVMDQALTVGSFTVLRKPVREEDLKRIVPAGA